MARDVLYHLDASRCRTSSIITTDRQEALIANSKRGSAIPDRPEVCTIWSAVPEAGVKTPHRIMSEAARIHSPENSFQIPISGALIIRPGLKDGVAITVGFPLSEFSRLHWRWVNRGSTCSAMSLLRAPQGLKATVQSVDGHFTGTGFTRERRETTP